MHMHVPIPKSAILEGQGLIWLWDGFCRKDNWEQMGTYDINMTEWGGEHIEVEKNLDGELHGNLLVRWESERYRCRSNQGMMFTPKCPNIVKDILKDHPTSSQNQPGPKSELQQSFKSG